MVKGTPKKEMDLDVFYDVTQDTFRISELLEIKKICIYLVMHSLMTGTSHRLTPLIASSGDCSLPPYLLDSTTL